MNKSFLLVVAIVNLLSITASLCSNLVMQSLRGNFEEVDNYRLLFISSMIGYKLAMICNIIYFFKDRYIISGYIYIFQLICSICIALQPYLINPNNLSIEQTIFITNLFSVISIVIGIIFCISIITTKRKNIWLKTYATLHLTTALMFTVIRYVIPRLGIYFDESINLYDFQMYINFIGSLFLVYHLFKRRNDQDSTNAHSDVIDD